MLLVEARRGYVLVKCHSTVLTLNLGFLEAKNSKPNNVRFKFCI